MAIVTLGFEKGWPRSRALYMATQRSGRAGEADDVDHRMLTEAGPLR